MFNSDRVKEELSNLRLFFTVFSAVSASLIAWVAQTPEHMDNPKVIAATVISVNFGTLLLVILWRMHTLLVQLEKSS